MLNEEYIEEMNEDEQTRQKKLAQKKKIIEIQKQQMKKKSPKLPVKKNKLLGKEKISQELSRINKSNISAFNDKIDQDDQNTPGNNILQDINSNSIHSNQIDFSQSYQKMPQINSKIRSQTNDQNKEKMKLQNQQKVSNFMPFIRSNSQKNLNKAKSQKIIKKNDQQNHESFNMPQIKQYTNYKTPGKSNQKKKEQNNSNSKTMGYSCSTQNYSYKNGLVKSSKQFKQPLGRYEQNKNDQSLVKNNNLTRNEEKMYRRPCDELINELTQVQKKFKSPYLVKPELVTRRMSTEETNNDNTITMWHCKLNPYSNYNKWSQQVIKDKTKSINDIYDNHYNKIDKNYLRNQIRSKGLQGKPLLFVKDDDRILDKEEETLRLDDEKVHNQSMCEKNQEKYNLNENSETTLKLQNQNNVIDFQQATFNQHQNMQKNEQNNNHQTNEDQDEEQDDEEEIDLNDIQNGQNIKKNYKGIVNKLEGAYEVFCSKNGLNKTLKDYEVNLKKQGSNFSIPLKQFIPETYNLNLNVQSYSDDEQTFINLKQEQVPNSQSQNVTQRLYDQKQKNKTPYIYAWLLKPCHGLQGQGIELFYDLEELKKFIKLKKQSKAQNTKEIQKQIDNNFQINNRFYENDIEQSEIQKESKQKFDDLSEQTLENLKNKKNKNSQKVQYAQLTSGETHVIQKYIQPSLLMGNKYDIRCYILIASVDPLLVYYHPGFARRTLHQYNITKENCKSQDDKMYHLTNQHLMKNHPDFQKNKEETIWSWEKVQQCWLDSGVSLRQIQSIHEKIKNIFRIVIKAGIHNCSKQRGQFELFGGDIIFDSDLNPYLLELNSNPGLSFKCKLNHQV
ncbi:hypothetical protein PPERSA_06360 [Pseudocohnilembus persalinus]|uniref:Tubulin-tyrosine ligase/Tubulin polyglutamylase n=1 Tax=Pseudocohnilembus persalinus TaxID=266149 RepID=A0A0V0QJI0_PSEPJ|nr:hypothetical protein PPERSA_06360 [Pseudocohnilembus persalinus]|eukprot:KRX02165.1 hypothetical protein PPERSA_06360 [Pseudocohnilembus persalinus]